MKKVLSIVLTGLLLSSCNTAPQQPDPFDLAISATMLNMLTQPIQPSQKKGLEP